MPDVNVTSFEIEMTTRHGDVVRADVYLPPNGAGPFPVLLAASAYQKKLRYLPMHNVFSFVEYGPMQLYLDQGYAYVTMDVPGAGRSTGTWDMISRTEGEAIHDMIERVATLEWADNLGMIGMSHYCWSQWNAARTRPAHLKTIGAFDGSADMYRDWMYHDGIPIQGFLNSWLFGSILLQHENHGIDFHAGRKDQAVYDIYSHPLDDEWRRSPFWELDQVNIPVFSIGAWGKSDLHLRGNFLGYERVRGPKQLLVVKAHTFADTQLLFATEPFHRDEMLPWYDYHFKGIENSVMDRPNVRFFVKNENVTLAATTWPPDAAPSTFYLSGALNDGSLTEEAPQNETGEITWVYPDPAWRAGVTVIGPDGVPNHVARVNTFTTAPFARDREFTLMPMSVLVKKGDRLRLEISNQDSLIADVPITHWYGAKVGHDTYYHNQAQPSPLILHERPR